MQDVKSSIVLKDVKSEHLEQGIAAWMQYLLQKAGLSKLTSQSFLMPDFMRTDNAEDTFCHFQTQIQLRKPHHVLLHMEAGEPCSFVQLSGNERGPHVVGERLGQA